MESPSSVRLDKWLWAVRLYKTRGLAAQACRGGHVAVSGVKAKPAREVRAGDLIESRHGEITRTTRVLGLIQQRVGAPAARVFAEDLTPASEYEKRRAENMAPISLRQKSQGRPTGKARRDMDDFLTSHSR